MVEATAGNPWRVLVVEDNPLIRESVALAIRRLNNRLAAGQRQVQLFAADNGATAWELVVANNIELVITDLYIPVLSGIKLIQKIRETSTTATLKILAISASIEDARVVSLGAGADKFLQKPIRLVDLIDALRGMLHLELT
ncbi:MAG: response regulator [Deltaproteobacteria bacterium]|nr:response regulator [Deltaproteobacteria bacterium]